MLYLVSDMKSAQAMAVVAGSFLSGTMMSLSLMTVPVFLDTTKQAPQLFQQWLSMYNYGFPVLPTISVATCSLYLYIAIRQRVAKAPWLIFAAAGVVTVTMLPFTWVFLWPTNDTIMQLEKDTRAGSTANLGEAQELIKLWSRTHFVRSFFPLVGSLIGLRGLLKEV